MCSACCTAGLRRSSRASPRPIQSASGCYVNAFWQQLSRESLPASSLDAILGPGSPLRFLPGDLLRNLLRGLLLRGLFALELLPIRPPPRARQDLDVVLD